MITKTTNLIRNSSGRLIGAALLLAISSLAVQAENISALNTGAGLYSQNNGAVLIDPNWKVTLLETIPAGQIPPGGIPNGSSYLVTNGVYPVINGTWVANDATSSWITYSSPTQVGADTTNDVFQYQLNFTALNTGVVDINLLSDNTGYLLINGTVIGDNPSEYTAWLTTPFQYTFQANTSYTVDFLVGNDGQTGPNPTGARVEFLGNVNVATAAPEPGSLALAGLSLGLLMVWQTRSRHVRI